MTRVISPGTPSICPSFSPRIETVMYLDRFKLTDRVAVVTGAARGIGFAISEALAEAGALVVLTDMEASALQGAVEQLGA